MRDGSARGLARALSLIENGHPLSASILHSLYDSNCSTVTVGITGPPGGGKSTLLNLLISHWREAGRRVGVIAVDPSSPFSGGALLGDRIRMQSHASDPDVFIRSMGSRGHLGGVSGATRDALEVLKAASLDPVIVETVGVGQAEVEIASFADITLLVLAPGFGDEMQAMKAGIMEIGDIIILNKADRQGIERLASAVAAALELMPSGVSRPPVVRCSAAGGEGIDTLTDTIDRLMKIKSPAMERPAGRVAQKIREIAGDRGKGLAYKIIEDEYGSLNAAVDAVLSGLVSPYMMGERLTELLDELLERKNESKGN